VFSYLNDKAAVKELFTVVAPKIATRPGGYTRIIKLGIRPGDNAEKAMIELVDFNEIYGNSIASATEPAKKTRRSKSTAAPKAAAAAAVAPVEATTTEEVSAEPTKNEEVSDEVSTDDANGDASTAE
jgi:large subunit ribosomal protein L17